MLVSRVRAQLAAWFGVAMVAGLVAMSVSLYAFLYRRADKRLTDELTRAATELAANVESRITGRRPDRIGPVVADELPEVLVDEDEVLAVYRPDGARLGTHGAASLLDGLRLPPNPAVWDQALATGERARFAMVRITDPALLVVAGESTARLRSEVQGVLFWLLVSVPLAALLAVLGGYALAGYAFRPVKVLAREIDTIDPTDLDRLLPVRSPPDEIDELAARFNQLLAKLQAARHQNRRFLADVAHQLKTPLTLVRGESALALKRARTPEEHREILRRIERAAHQMAHRVDDLFMLAGAEAGERPQLTDDIELDGIALECADLMRRRASEEGHRLELDRVEPVRATGSEPLVRELVLELLENAVRYGESTEPIRISAYADGDGVACVDVTSAGPPVTWNGDDGGQGGRAGLGLSIVRWIAEVHGGEVRYVREGRMNRFSFRWPAGQA